MSLRSLRSQPLLNQCVRVSGGTAIIPFLAMFLAISGVPVANANTPDLMLDKNAPNFHRQVRKQFENTISNSEGASTHASDLLTEVPSNREPQAKLWVTAQAPDSLSASPIEETVDSSPEESQAAPPAEPPATESDTSASQANLAQQSQNPIANLISVPFQFNTTFGVGQFDRTSVVLNIQPVIPTPLSSDLVLINRFIVPLAYQPELAQVPLPDGSTESIGDVFGLGDIIYQGFFSPSSSGNFTWGVGPILSFPTATDTVLGAGQWSAGPAVVGLVTSRRVVTGVLASQLWSYAGDSDRPDVSLMTIQPFFNYNFDQGWYITTSPIITANWEAESDNQWTVPLGGGFGRVFNIGRQPVNASLAAYWNVVSPEGAADWTLRTQITLLFP